MKAIVTKYRGPDDKNGSRILVSWEGGRLAVPFPIEARDANTFACATALRKLSWSGAWIGGTLPDGKSIVYVCVLDKILPATINGVTIDKVLGHA